MKHLKTLETYTCNMHVYATSKSTFATSHPDKTLATYVWTRWNIWNIHLKHTCIAIPTCAIFSIYFCNIDIQHLQHTSEIFETLETYSCNIWFSPFLRTTQHKVGERPIPASRRSRMMARLGSAAMGCGDEEQRVRRRPIEAGDGESVWVGLRSGCRKQHVCSRTSRQRLCFLSGGRGGGANVQGPRVRERGNKWGGQLGYWHLAQTEGSSME
jgi:hypothetical protein